MPRAFLCGAVLAALTVSSAIAQTKNGPSASGEVAIEIQNDWNYRSDDRANLYNDLFTKIEPSLTVRFAPEWSLFAHAVLEPVTPADQFENRAFEDHGLFVEDLYLEFDNGTFGARAGKLNVGFGVAWEIAPGVYGRDFAEDGYETSERIGVIGSYTLDAARAGRHRFSAGSFFQDTTVLSESTFRGRGDTRRQDGGVSNTESFESFILSANGENIAALGKLGYHVAYMHQAKGAGDAADEDSIAVALFSSFDIGGGVTFSPLLEYVRQDSPGGVADDERDFLTLAGTAEWKGFNVAAAWTRRDTDSIPDDDYQFQLSAGYAFGFGVSVDVGWKIANEGGIETRTIGILVAYGLEF